MEKMIKKCYNMLKGEYFMEAFITTNLAYFKTNNINTNFTKLSKEYNLDRHTLKMHVYYLHMLLANLAIKVVINLPPFIKILVYP